METATFRSAAFRSAAFKSYYVVWKRVYIFFFRPRLPRLNRTMQYGNLFASVPDGKVYVGLNRTMQYGNLRPLQSQPYMDFV